MRTSVLTAIAPLTWGTTYLVTSQWLPPGHPLWSGLLRALPAGLIALALGSALPRGHWWWRSLVLGALNIGLFFPLLFLAAYRLPGGVAGIFGAVGPLVVALVAVPVLGERLSLARLLWGLLAVAGVAAMVVRPESALDALGVVAGLGGAVLMALGTVFTKRWTPPVGAVAMTGWQLTRAMRSWSWPGCDGQETEVEVYARASAVELFVNGTSVGKKSPKAGRCIFRTAYHDGEITAVSYDASGLEIGRDTLHTAGKETVFRLEPETTQCAPGEMVYFRIRITDENGETKPMEKLTVTVSAENGELMGTASASCSYTGNFAGNVVPTYFGEAQAIVRAGKPGPIRVTAVSGSYTATAEVICK